MTLIATLDDPIICDMTLPWFTDHMVDQDITLPRFKKAGVDFVSLTVSVPTVARNPARRRACCSTVTTNAAAAARAS